MRSCAIRRLEASFRVSPMGAFAHDKEVEDENDDENDWGSGGGKLRPTIAGIVFIKAIDQSGRHCHHKLAGPPSIGTLTGPSMTWVDQPKKRQSMS